MVYLWKGNFCEPMGRIFSELSRTSLVYHMGEQVQILSCRTKTLLRESLAVYY